MIPIAVLGGLLTLWLLLSLEVLKAYERGVILRMGQLLPMPLGPGQLQAPARTFS